MAAKEVRNKKKGRSSEWSKSGSFMNKPDRGWIHPDFQLDKEAGICYGVRYIGCIEVKESMRSLDFETRTALAREAINRVCEAAGLKTTKKRKVDKKLTKMLGEKPILQYAGSNVNLTISTECLNLMIMESGEIIATHQMPGISFASGGDAETLDFVSYVAKDLVNGRACHVLECGGGLSEDVITTIGQAFELRFKEYLKNQPKAMEIPDRSDGPLAEADAWGDDENEYYNDRPDARPPSPPSSSKAPLAEYATPPSNLPVSDGVYSSVKDNKSLVYDTPKEQPLIDLSDNGANVYDNKENSTSPEFKPNVYDNKENVLFESLPRKPPTPPTVDNLPDVPPPRIREPVKQAEDPFDLEPFSAELPPPRNKSQQNGIEEKPLEDKAVCDTLPPLKENPNPGKGIAPVFEEWYHGALPRKQAEKLLQKDGDFLVRKSSSDPNQFVLSGRQNGMIKHLLLVDPDGVVRTKDHTFESVPHLISYHRSKNFPIISQESVLYLVRPISNNYTNC
ncbi:SHC-transforming protein 1-like isoform X1 [Ostrea edulis]|uniref:SHC-transforming protein 1-like isoform X1 n=1 Tax=Ostrea edulis TaxID=37623 RepID=UPI0024AEF4E6|nr:SHC-transforming protein 1-like isoform X1 [Ostrea edulis]